MVAQSGSMDWKRAGSMADWTALRKVGSWPFSKGDGSAGQKVVKMADSWEIEMGNMFQGLGQFWLEMQ
jgi:hypothetical protein